MAAPRTGLWLLIGGVCFCLCTCVCGAVLVSELKQAVLKFGAVPVGVAKSLALEFESMGKGLEFLNWLLSALLGWLQKVILPFL